MRINNLLFPLLPSNHPKKYNRRKKKAILYFYMQNGLHNIYNMIKTHLYFLKSTRKCFYYPDSKSENT